LKNEGNIGKLQFYLPSAFEKSPISVIVYEYLAVRKAGCQLATQTWISCEVCKQSVKVLPEVSTRHIADAREQPGAVVIVN